MIRARGLVKRHGEQEVLRGITLDVERGDVAVVIGPSGGGKSTFLRCLNGLERLDEGSVEIGPGPSFAPGSGRPTKRGLYGRSGRVSAWSSSNSISFPT